MSDLKIQGVVEMSSEGAESALNRVADKAGQMANRLVTEANKAGKAVDGIGDGASKSADEFTRSEGRIVASIKRAQTSLELLGKTASQKLEFKISEKGLDVSKFEPYLAKLREVEAAQIRMSNSANSNPIGSGFTRQLQNTSYQLQDFVVQVNGGTSAVKALGQQLPQMLVGFGAAGAAVGVLAALLPNIISAFSSSADSSKKFADTLSDFDKAVGEVGKTTKEFDMDKLYVEFNKSSDAVRAATIEQIKFQQEYIRTTQLVAEKKLGESVGGLGGYSTLDKLKGSFAGSSSDKLAGQLGISADVAKDLLPAIKGLSDGSEDVTLAFNKFGTALLGGNQKAIELATTLSSLSKSQRDAAAASSSLSDALDKMAKGGNIKTGKDSSASGEASAYDTLNKAIQERLSLATAELQSQGQLSAWEKTRVELMARVAASSTKLTAEEKSRLLVEIDTIAAYQESAATRNAWIKSQEAIAAAREKSIQSINDEAAKIEEENSLYGLTKSQIEAVTIARLDELLAKKKSEGSSGETISALEREIEARKRLRDSMISREAKDANKRAVDEVNKEWQRGWEATDRLARDAFTTWAEDGGDAAKKIGDTLRKALLSAIYEATLKPIVMQVYTSATGALGLSGGAGSIGAGVSNAGGLVNTASSLYGLFNGSSSLAASGAALAAYGSFATSSLGASLGLSTATAAGYAAPVYASAAQGGALLSAGSGTAAGGLTAAGSTGASIASTIGTALPWVGAALAVYSLFSGKNKEDPHNNADTSGVGFMLKSSGVFGNPGGGWNDQDTGFNGLTPFSYTAGQTSGRGRWEDKYALPAATVKAIAASTSALFFSGHEFAKMLGTDSAAIDTASVSGKFASVEEAMTKLGDAIAKNIIPNIDDFTKSGETLTQTLSRLGQEFQLTDQIAGLMGKSGTAAFGSGTAGLTNRDSLVSLLGGASSATTALDGYIESFYSEAEKKARVQDSISATLKAIGLDAIPQTRDEFRNLVEAQDLATESGRRMYATLIAVSGSFAGVADAAVTSGRDIKTSSFASRTDYLRVQRATGKAEVVTVSDPKVMNELAQLRAQFANLEAGQVSLARFALKSAQVIEKWEGIGMPVARAAL